MLHLCRLERLARDKHSSLLKIFVNYGQKSFITSGLREKIVEGRKQVDVYQMILFIEFITF